MNEKNLNTKVYKATGTFDVKEIKEQERTIVAYGSAFGVKDSHSDIVVKGAFAGSIDKKILFLNAHGKWDTTNVLGVISKMEEDDFGLRFEVKIVDTPAGNTILELYKSGVPLQHSIGGYYGKGADAVSYDQDQGAYIVKSFDLMEISVVPFGSNPKTPLVAIKEEGNEVEALKVKLANLEERFNSFIAPKEDDTPEETIQEQKSNDFDIDKFKNLLSNTKNNEQGTRRKI